MSLWWSTKFLFVLYLLYDTKLVSAQTCNINGQVFQAGQSLGENFITHCGSAEDFPCFCNPDLEQQVECPYCGFALLGDDLLCAGDNEVVSFVDIDGDDKICECSAPKGGTPTPNCDVSRSTQSVDTCTIDLRDGTSMVFSEGTSLGDFLPNRCGSEFPCFCNPSIPGQIECPYCRFPSMGGDLVCSRADESVTYRDLKGNDHTCSCQASPNNPNEPIASCVASGSLGFFSNPDESRAGPTCTIDLPDGTTNTYNEGDSLGNFRESRCGSEFPCFCNPSVAGQIECPYCRFVSMGGDLVCARDGESVTYEDLEGVDRTCSCEIPNNPNADPVTNCFESSLSGFFSNSDGSRADTTCTIELPDGTTNTYNEGDSLGDFRESRCGSEFPCFCNPLVEGQIECPYCRFVSMGGDLVCARDGESVNYRDLEGADHTCSCEIPNNPNAEPITSCLESPNPLQVTDVPQLDVCTLELESGQILTFANGESYGDYLTTRCASSEKFPCFCNPALYNQMECPYCGFASGDGSLYCAKDQETISFADGGITKTCSCEIPDDPFQSPVLSCSEGGPPPTNAPVVPPLTMSPNNCTFTKPNGEIVTIKHEGSFGNLIEGVCGPAEEWPAFCNMDLGNTITRSANNAEYPYCIFQNTASGDPVCVRSNEEVTFKDENGVAMTCSCLYLHATLGGAQATCQKADNPVPAPSPEATLAPSLRPQPQGTSSAFVASWTMGIPWSMFMAFNLII